MYALEMSEMQLVKVLTHCAQRSQPFVMHFMFQSSHVRLLV